MENYLNEFDKIFNEYKKYTFATNLQEELQLIYKYVNYSNRLEGNKLNLSQTTALLKDNIIIGDKIPFFDILETKGLFKATQFIISSAKNNYPLSEKIIKQANYLTLSNVWNDDSNYYSSYKLANQELGEYKVKQNKIVWNINNKSGEITPASTPDNAKENCIKFIDKFNNSKAHIIEKIAYLVSQIYINQLFVDANKRTARLITSFVSIKQGLPFTAFDNQPKNTNFNHVLISSYLEGNKNIIEEFIAKVFMTEMSSKMEKENKLKTQKPKNLGFMI